MKSYIKEWRTTRAMAINRDLLYTMFELQELSPFDVRDACNRAGCSPDSYYRLLREYIRSGGNPVSSISDRDQKIIAAAMANPSLGKRTLFKCLKGEYPLSTVHHVLRKYGILDCPNRFAASFIHGEMAVSQPVQEPFRNKNTVVIPPFLAAANHAKQLSEAVISAGSPLKVTSIAGRNRTATIPVLCPGSLFYFFMRTPALFSQKVIELSVIDHVTGFAYCEILDHDADRNSKTAITKFIDNFKKRTEIVPQSCQCNCIVIVDTLGEVPALQPLTERREGRLKRCLPALAKFLFSLKSCSFYVIEQVDHPFIKAMANAFYPAFTGHVGEIPFAEKLLPGFVLRYNNRPSRLPFALGKSPMQMLNTMRHLIDSDLP